MTSTTRLGQKKLDISHRSYGHQRKNSGSDGRWEMAIGVITSQDAIFLVETSTTDLKKMSTKEVLIHPIVVLESGE